MLEGGLRLARFAHVSATSDGVNLLPALTLYAPVPNEPLGSTVLEVRKRFFFSKSMIRFDERKYVPFKWMFLLSGLRNSNIYRMLSWLRQFILSVLSLTHAKPWQQPRRFLCFSEAHKASFLFIFLQLKMPLWLHPFPLAYLHNVIDQWVAEHPVQVDALILQNVLQGIHTSSSWPETSKLLQRQRFIFKASLLLYSTTFKYFGRENTLRADFSCLTSYAQGPTCQHRKMLMTRPVCGIRLHTVVNQSDHNSCCHREKFLKRCEW